MIGNDIVDLAQAKRESNWQRKGFLAKLFTPQERQLVLQSDSPERMVWLLWSMKESAYKAHLRETGKREFAPHKIECQLTSMGSSEVSGTVHYENQYQTRSVINPQYVASFTVSADAVCKPVILSLASSAHQAQSTTVREALIRYCADFLSTSMETITIQKDRQGVPNLIIRQSAQELVTIPISISHHGQYGAYLIAFPD